MVIESAHDGVLRRIAEQEGRIRRQEQLVADLAGNARAAPKAEELLHVMRATLSVLRACLEHFEEPN